MHAKHVSAKQSDSSRSRKRRTHFEPLFVSLHDGSIPVEINEESGKQLRHNIMAWTQYIDRLSSAQSQDTETKFYVARARLRWGVAYTLFSEWQAAISDLTHVIAMNVGEAETNTAYMYRAQAYDAAGQYASSMQDWTHVLTAIEHASSHPERFSKELAAQGYAFRARLYCRQENYRQAVSDCDCALALDGKCAEAYSVRGRASSFLNKWAAALSDCTKAIELAGWPVHYYRRGLVQKQIGNYEQAFADFELAYQREPENLLFKQEYTELLMLRLIRVGVSPSSSPEQGSSRLSTTI